MTHHRRIGALFLFLVLSSTSQSCTILSNPNVAGSPVILYGSGCRCADFVPPEPPKCDCDKKDNNGGGNNGGGEPPKPIPPICPKDTGGEMWMVRHETDCHMYYECTDRRKVKKSCKEGENFNVDLELCDILVNVDCAGRDHYPCEWTSS